MTEVSLNSVGRLTIDTLGDLPPVVLSVGQQMLSFNGVGPLFNYGIAKLVNPSKALFQGPTLVTSRNMFGVALLNGFVTTGINGFSGLPFAGTIKKFGDDYISSNTFLSQHQDSQRYLKSFFDDGLIGVGNCFKADFDQSFLGTGVTTGQVMTWGMYLGLAMVYLPAVTMARGMGADMSVVLTGLGLGIICSMTSTVINDRLGSDPARVNLNRQGMLFCMNLMATLAKAKNANGDLYLLPRTAFGIQAMIALGIYLAYDHFTPDLSKDC